MSCSPQGLGDGNNARLKLGDRIQMMIARKYRPKLTRSFPKIVDKENAKISTGRLRFYSLSFWYFHTTRDNGN